ncbi:MAG: hypothetical protein E4H01_01105 [Lysobacterales bacterium]|nr:MAG: hypothetical protein E4H01_01105 [Xanthomonadales bacterium]
MTPMTTPDKSRAHDARRSASTKDTGCHVRTCNETPAQRPGSASASLSQVRSGCCSAAEVPLRCRHASNVPRCLNPGVLQDIGYSIAIYPITLMLAGIHAMEQALAALAAGQTPDNAAEFAHLRDIVGFPDYYEAETRYAAD